jgi:uncharacterized protein (TIGR02271 family)
MAYEKIVTLFDTAEHAEAARHNLEAAGFPGSEISVVSSNALTASGQALREPGLWHRLFGNNIEQHEATVYGRTVEAGGVVLTLRTQDTDVPKAMDILDGHSDKTVDIKERAVEHGLLPAASAVSTAKAAVASAPAKVAAAAAAATAAVGVKNEEVLRLAEEQLEVGKRLVQEGTTRIRRFVTERPVEAKVTLHEEHAEVVRRAITDPKYIKDIDWTDRTIEVTETAEEAVVSKSAHIAEEVVIGKTGSDRVETVRNTVRRQQVEVEHVPGETARKA